MNFLLSIFLFILFGLIQGIPSDKALLGDMVPDSPAEEAGFQKGDEIIQIGDQPISTWNGFSEIVTDSADETLDMVIDRNGEEISLAVTPYLDEDPEIGGGKIGVYQGFEKRVGKECRRRWRRS